MTDRPRYTISRPEDSPPTWAVRRDGHVVFMSRDRTAVERVRFLMQVIEPLREACEAAARLFSELHEEECVPENRTKMLKVRRQCSAAVDQSTGAATMGSLLGRLDDAAQNDPSSPLLREAAAEIRRQRDLISSSSQAFDHVDDRAERAETLLRDLIEQVRQDFAAAHATIIELQGGKPGEYEWPEHTTIANTLRWFDKVEQDLEQDDDDGE